MSPFVRTLGVVLLLATTGSLVRAQIVVTSLDDNGNTGGAGDCELREALRNAEEDNQAGSTDCAAGSGADIIDLTGLTGTIVLSSELPAIGTQVTLQGPGADQLTIDAGRSGHVFNTGGVVTVNDLTVTGGRSSLGGGVANAGTLTINRSRVIDNYGTGGAGIYNTGTLTVVDSEISGNKQGTVPSAGSGSAVYSAGGTVEIIRSTLSHNESVNGGAVYTLGSVVVKIVNSTISGNTAFTHGGGIGSLSTDSVVVWNSTITGNTAGSLGGGIFSGGGVHLASTVVAKNTAGSGADVYGTVSSDGYNFVGNNDNTSGVSHGVNGDQVGTSGSPIDPMLFPLGDFGGYTLTHLPRGGSPLLDKGSCTFSSVTADQRGTAREQDLSDGTYPDADDACDIGSVEAESSELIDGIEVSAGVFLEGPYEGSESMSLDLAVPTAQPYSDALFDGTENEYDGGETVASVPADVVDWLLISIRTGTTPNTEVFEGPAFLKDDGTIVGLDGNAPLLPTPNGNYYLVVRHRNHVSVMSSGAVNATSGSLSWDFRSNLANAYTSGGSAMKSLGGGKYGLFAADGNADGSVTAPDFNLWISATTAGTTGYVPSDYNMDGDVTAPDFNLWSANTTAGAASQVPD